MKVWRISAYPSSDVDVEVSAVGTKGHSDHVTKKIDDFFGASKTRRRFETVHCHPVRTNSVLVSCLYANLVNFEVYLKVPVS